jgi:hypothetical protein
MAQEGSHPPDRTRTQEIFHAGFSQPHSTGCCRSLGSTDVERRLNFLERRLAKLALRCPLKVESVSPVMANQEKFLPIKMAEIGRPIARLHPGACT